MVRIEVSEELLPALRQALSQYIADRQCALNGLSNGMNEGTLGAQLECARDLNGEIIGQLQEQGLVPTRRQF